ncbi:uncharacterized protein LOC116192829 [Punica granatum]|uniref:Uncharacterized protein LOC116192829 n=1 Tax=Punica granatum TaxID=22663 RepID=A0A6P8C6H7_PUNGR|nr:uncharacterized protein LOC116192829 [Punica granatum]
MEKLITSNMERRPSSANTSAAFHDKKKGDHPFPVTKGCKCVTPYKCEKNGASNWVLIITKCGTKNEPRKNNLQNVKHRPQSNIQCPLKAKTCCIWCMNSSSICIRRITVIMGCLTTNYTVLCRTCTSKSNKEY